MKTGTEKVKRCKDYENLLTTMVVKQCEKFGSLDQDNENHIPRIRLIGARTDSGPKVLVHSILNKFYLTFYFSEVNQGKDYSHWFDFIPPDDFHFDNHCLTVLNKNECVTITLVNIHTLKVIFSNRRSHSEIYQGIETI